MLPGVSVSVSINGVPLPACGTPRWPRPPVIRLAVKEKSHTQGGAPLDLALVMTDTQFAEVGVQGPFLDNDNKPFPDNPDGSPFAPAVSLESSDQNVLTTEDNPAGGKIARSGSPGQCMATLSIGPYPGGQLQQYQVAVTILNSAPKPANVVIGPPQEETPAP